ncbi:MAG: CDP-glucose 4,6-dehydratase, partial [Actinomycetota bacterium]
MSNFLKDYSGKRILVTGHTGFKGAWLSRILVLAGAEVYGLALAADANSLFDVAGDLGFKESTILDIRDRNAVEKYFTTHRFDGIFHMAAQPLVRRSYKEPIETFDTNVMGTAHVLNAAVSNSATHWVVAITTDKVYRNVEKLGGYSEDEPLGGKDPYSA